MNTTSFLLTLLAGAALSNTALAEETSDDVLTAVLRPTLDDVGGAGIAEFGGANPTVSQVPQEDFEWLVVRDDFGNIAMLDAPGGSLFGDSSEEELNAFLAAIDADLYQIGLNYDAAMESTPEDSESGLFAELDEPLCVGCMPSNPDIAAVNKAVATILQDLYIQQYPSLEIPFDFRNLYDYDIDDINGYLESLLDFMDFQIHEQMMQAGPGNTVVTQVVLPTYPGDDVGIAGSDDTIVMSVHSFLPGHAMSGKVYITLLDAAGVKWHESLVADNDKDEDGIPNHLDNDIDGDGWPNWLDCDKDGDGVRNWRDAEPENPNVSCYPRRPGSRGPGGIWVPPTPEDYGAHMAAILDQSVEEFLSTVEARELVSAYHTGAATVETTVIELNAAYQQQNAANHAVFSTPIFYVP